MVRVILITCRASGQPLDSYLFYNMASGITKYGVKSNYSQSQKMSYALRLNYVYNDKYIASFTTRWDGAPIWPVDINGNRFRQGRWHGVFRRSPSWSLQKMAEQPETSPKLRYYR